MAGSFTASMFKEFSLNFDKAHDKVIVIGEKGYKFILSNYGAGAILKHLTMSEKPDDFVYIKYLAKLVNKLYKNNEFRDVKVQYNKFKTTNQFASYTAQILPLDQKLIAPQSNAERHLTFLVEPSPMNAFLHTLDMYLQSMIYTALLETKLCEHLSRKNAMLEASANEDAKIIDLKMSYNKKRQEKITAEVSLLSLTL
jgi:F-type H+-transporting ATPase subunit gamma